MIGFRTRVLNPLVGVETAGGRSRRSARRAFGLMDGIIFLTLAAAFIVGVMSIGGSAMTRSAANDTVQDVTNLSLATRTIRGANGYPADIEGALRSLGQIPSNITDDGTALSNQWGGAIKITQTTGGSGFTIEYDDVPGPECRLIMIGVKPGVLRSVNNKNLTDVDATFASTECADDNANTVTFSSLLAS